ncbi:MAG TPA: pitrilysin family protein [Terriglobia bacterium]|nr:pitrilysin family protein [Terriglobia bacterium]
MNFLKNLPCRGFLAIVVLSAVSCRSREPDYSIQFTDTRLKNGMRVILSEDHSAPTYSLAVVYNAGARDEKAGRSGFAHLFEHMMFEGSENVGKGEHFSLIENNGGSTNGNTTSDRTLYYETLPANQLDLGLFLEADRMRSLAITEANFRNQLETVKEERRENYDNQPYGRTYEIMMETAYDNYAYKHIAIGSMADLNASNVDDARAFFKIYYAPNNAVLSLVGDFKSDDALAKIRTYFEDIPQQPPPPAPDMTEPPQTAERRRTYEDPLADLTEVDVLFKTPAGNTPEYYALDVIATILGSGKSSRLYQKMVKEKQVAQEVSAYADERRGPGVFALGVTVRPDKDPKEIERLLYEELERLKTEPVKDSEMDKVRMQVKRYMVDQQETTGDRARMLGMFAVFYDDPGLINSLTSKYAAVTPEQIQQVAREYFSEMNRTVVTTVPKAAARTAAGKAN